MKPGGTKPVVFIDAALSSNSLLEHTFIAAYIDWVTMYIVSTSIQTFL